MKRLALMVLAVLCLLPAARAQSYGLSNGYCEMGAVSALTQGLKSTNTLQGVIPFCSIRVNLHGTQTLATLYSDANGDPLANPFTATNTGYWQFYAANNAQYDVIGSGGIPPNTYLTPTLIPGSGGSGGGGSSPPQYSVQFAANGSGAFGSDPSITINPITHVLQAPEFYAPGGGTGVLELGDSTTGNLFSQSVQPGQSDWSWYWPKTYPALTGYCLVGSTGGIGAWGGCPIDATLFPGATIDLQVQAAFNACSFNCEVDIPPGPNGTPYTFVNPIILPLNFTSTYKLKLLPGAALRFNGTGCAINTAVVTAPTESTIDVSGGIIYGSSAGAGGVCIQPTNSFNVHDIKILGFTNGAGVWIEGANAGTVQNIFAANNAEGVYATPTYCSGATCGTTPVASAFTPNAINVVNNSLPSNGWGVWFYDSVSAGLSGALLVNISGNDVENNSIGGVFVERSHAANIEKNYFEGSPIGIEAGNSAGAQFWASQGLNIKGNYFTVTTGMTWDIYLANSLNTIIEGNSQQYVSENSSNCFINGLPYVGGVSGGEVATKVGQNHLELAGVGNTLCDPAAFFIGSISGTTLTVGGTVTGVIQTGQSVTGPGVSAGTTITGGSGSSWTVNNSQTVGAETINTTSGVSALTGAGSYSEINANYQLYVAAQQFNINTTVTSETVGLQFLTSNGICVLNPETTAARTSYLAGTSYLSTPANGSILFTHPSGTAMIFDILCANNPTGGFQ